MPWAPSYVSVDELQVALRIPVADTLDDTMLQFAIDAASRAIDQVTNRQFGLVASAEAREYRAEWNKTLCRYAVDIDDLQTTTGLLVAADDDDDGVYDDDTWVLNAEDGFYMDPMNAPDKGRPWTRIVFRSDADAPPLGVDKVRVTGRFGWTVVPETIKQATLVQASRFFYRREAPFGVAGSPSTGSEIRLLSMVDPDVAVMVRPYRRQWGSA